MGSSEAIEAELRGRLGYLQGWQLAVKELLVTMKTGVLVHLGTKG